MKKKIFSLLLALAMVLSLMPVGALAATEPAYYDTVKADGTIERGGAKCGPIFIPRPARTVLHGARSVMLSRTM